MKKVLFVAHVDSHIRHFHIPYMKYFKDQGYEVHVATSDDEGEQFDYCDKKHKITMERSPFKLNNIKAIKQMTKLVEDEKFDIVTCHTPMGGVVTRLAVRKLRRQKIQSDAEWSPTKMQVLYTAHGLHFFKGAPLINWLLYYPIEKWLSKYTDKLILINQEDYNTVIAKKFKAKKIYKIDGVGVDAGKFNFIMSDKDKIKFKKELSNINDKFRINDDDVVISCVGELNANKNQDLIIDVIDSIVHEDVAATIGRQKDDTTQSLQNIKVLLVGTGVYKEHYEKRIKSLGLEKYILLTGYRKDIPEILKICDIAISCSYREGLPFNLIEAQMSELPCVVTNCRGNNEIVEENKTGFLIDLKDKKKCLSKFTNKLLKLCNSQSMRERMGKNALENSKKYKLSRALDEMKKIYGEKI